MSSISHIAKNLVRTPLEWTAAQFGSHRRKSTVPRLWVLMYHRILPKDDPRYRAEEPGMIVEPETFGHHLRQLQRHFTLIPLREWIDRWSADRPLPAKACAITFDDGWADNYEYAFPILQREQVPATLFAVSHMIGTDQQFWPNRINDLLRRPPRHWQSIDWLQPLLANPAQVPDQETIAGVIQHLKQHPDSLLHQRLAQIDTSGDGGGHDAALMNWTQLREMAASGLVDVGSHTCHHFRLREDLEPKVLIKELEDSKARLQAELDQPIELFCYPNGDVCDLALSQVSKLYKAAVTTAAGINRANQLQPFQLLRIGVHQDRSDSADKLGARLSGWL
ncbi:polysaccharide deacetylase family protein [Exilibacterium tricleocarpae]|uniref:Polysaccharide deacetylase family protein n=1 Tax=Exilibacterium tricleocarpae TaxID=2591008 RepID=A0A545T3G7_9GAMM|nr:polysaccharide deacetylase family protein [Exilibacterium tricleocarpae]TQV71759.1 polysaccharide deacetylase family protein [Exilibacterium tricleocarpae]